MLALPGLQWTLTFPEAEAEGLGRQEHSFVRGQLHLEGKDPEALLHPPSGQESVAALGRLFSPFHFPIQGVSQVVELR